MKHLIYFFLLSLTFFGSNLLAQSVTLTSSNNAVEIGEPTLFTATLNPNGGDVLSIEEFRWYAPQAGVGLSGACNVVGDINSTFTEPFIDAVNAYSSAVDIVLGDFTNAAFSNVIVEVDYLDSLEDSHTLSTNMSLPINRVCPPTLSGAFNVQECCREPETYYASNYCEADYFEWEVIPASAASYATNQNGTSFVVTPNSTSSFTIKCTAYRNQAGLACPEETTRVVNRYAPVTPPIQGDDYLCVGNQYTYYITPICGSTGVDWSEIPFDLIDVLAMDGYSITFSPKESAVSLSGLIGGSLTMQDCEGTTVTTKTFKIYSYDIPPAPQGYIQVVTDPDFDPCDDYILNFNFIASNPYANGITYVTPSHFIGVPHHQHVSPITVTVCYYNPCSGVKICTTYEVDLPEPCDDFGRGLVSSSSDNEDKDLTAKYKEETPLTTTAPIISPNPFSEQLNLSFSKITDVPGSYKVFSLLGQPVAEGSIPAGTQQMAIDLANLTAGGYLLQVYLSEQFYAQKVIKN